MGQGVPGGLPPPADPSSAARTDSGHFDTSTLRHFDTSTLRHFDTKKHRRAPPRRQDHPPSVTIIKISVTRNRHGQARRRSPRRARRACITCHDSPRQGERAMGQRGQVMWYITQERRKHNHRQRVEDTEKKMQWYMCGRVDRCIYPIFYAICTMSH